MSQDGKIPFKKLKPGDVFRFGNNVFMKTESIPGSNINAVFLNNRGLVVHFTDSEMVLPSEM